MHRTRAATTDLEF